MAIEAKTTLSGDTTSIRISSEHQLDGQGLDRLFLAQMALSTVAESGESLPEIIHSVAGLFGADLVHDFMDRLGDAGYLETDVDKYCSRRFMLRFIRAFEITEGFPRILASEVRGGVSEVNYSIDISGYIESAITVDELVRMIEEKRWGRP